MSGTVGQGDTVDYETGNTWDGAIWFDVTAGTIVSNTNSSETVSIDGVGATIGGDGSAATLVVAASPVGGPFVFTGNITASTFQLGGSGAEFSDPGLQISGGDLTASDTLIVDAAETLTVGNDGSITGPAETATPGVFDFGQIEVNSGTVTAGQFELQGSLDFSNGSGTFGTLVVGSFTGEFGSGGTGQLSIENGGSVDVTGPFVEDSQQGAGVANIAGGTIIVGDEADIGFDGNASFSLTSGGSVSVASSLDIGVEGTATGTISVSGDGSTLSAGAGMTVGDAGAGSVNIGAGGQVSTSDDVVIGATSGATGTITISGDDSLLDDGGALVVGYGGAGVLQINQGSIDVLDGIAAVGLSSGATGAITLTSASLDLSGNLSIGLVGAGSVEVDTDGNLQAQNIVLGGSANANGAITVSGSGAMAQSSALTIGDNGAGDLEVSAQGSLDTTGSAVLGSAVLGSAAVPAVEQTAAVLGQAQWTIGSGLDVGESGNGSIDISSGGQVFASSVVIGDNKNATGTVLVAGTVGISGGVTQASALLYGGALTVGGSGAGTLTVDQDGTVGVAAKGTVEIGMESGGTGSIAVSGAGSSLFASLLDIGGSTLAAGGSGTLTIGTGGNVTAGTVTVWSGGSIALTGGDLTTDPITVDGEVSGFGTIAGAITDNGTITADNGNLTLTGPVSGGGNPRYRAQRAGHGV